jgi:hypothetical protein
MRCWSAAVVEVLVYGGGWVRDGQVPKPYLPHESDENEAGGTLGKDMV